MSTELTPPDLTQTAGIVDPSLAAQPLNERSFDALKVQPDVQQTAVEGNEPGEFGMETSPLASQELPGGHKLVMLYSVEADGQEYQVWTGQMPDGSNFKDAAMVTHADFDVSAPKDDPRSWQVSLSSLTPSELHLPTGKENEFVSFQLDKYGLQIGGKSGQEAVQVLSHTPAAETAESPMLHAEKLKVAEDAGEMAVEKTVAATESAHESGLNMPPAEPVAASERPALNLVDAINEGADPKQLGSEQNPFDSARFGGNINGENKSEKAAPTEFDPARFGAKEATAVPEDEQAPEAGAEAAPTLGDIFATGESFANALQDPQLDPAVRTNLNKLQTSWRELQLATSTNEVWNEVLAPRLGELKDILPALIHENGRIVDSAQMLAAGLHNVARAFEEGDFEGAGNVLRNIGVSREDFENAFLANGQPREDAELGKVTNLLTQAEIDADDRISRVADTSMYSRLSTEQAEAMVSQLRPMIENGGSLDEAIASLQSQMPEGGPAWRQRQQAVQEVVGFARAGSRGQDIGRTVLRQAKEGLDLLSEDIRRGGRNSMQAYEVSARLQQVTAALEPVQHFMRIVSAQAEMIR